MQPFWTRSCSPTSGLHPTGNMEFLLAGHIGLAVALAAFLIGLTRRRPAWVTAGTVVAAPTCLALALLFWAAPVLAVPVVVVASALSAWALRRAGRVLAALLLLPFGVFLVATALRVPLRTDQDGTSAIGLALGDLDGDGHLDIVLARGHHSPVVDAILFNDGNGRFELHRLSDIADPSFSVALGDLNGDGDLDVVIGNDRHHPGRIYSNDGSRRFTLAGSFGSPEWNSRTVLLSDLDGDGRPDLVIANRDRPNQPGGTYACLNDGGGQFPSCRVLLQESASDIAAGDIDGDRAVDLVVPHADRGRSSVLLNDGRGGFDEKRPFGLRGLAVGVGGVALGDLDADGRPDIVLADQAGGASAYFNRSGGAFSDGVPIGDSRDRVFSVHVADMNGDGKADVVLGMGAMQAVLLLNDGDARTFTRLGLGNRRGIVSGLAGYGIAYGLASGDLNGDAVPDVVIARAFLPSMVYMNALRSRSRPGGTPTLSWRRLIETD